MKKILLVLLLMVSINCFSQTESDSVLIPRSELNEVFNAIDTLMEQDSIKNILDAQVNRAHTPSLKYANLEAGSDYDRYKKLCILTKCGYQLDNKVINSINKVLDENVRIVYYMMSY